MSNDYSVRVEIEFPEERHARIAYKVLSVDKEPNRSRVERELKAEGNKLSVNFRGSELRKLRVASNSIFDLSYLVVNTIHQFE
ncbi:uncharacterized protein LOC106667377 [Cimex lectularius]|uniref:L antigen family member 3 n=1 Tax=Cimex lectularius TaxID=79782 RepID=A0A8I6RSM4_CIMLE|nr:uncharacterized protein LOC106667377 [Cimex lectularius]